MIRQAIISSVPATGQRTTLRDRQQSLMGQPTHLSQRLLSMSTAQLAQLHWHKKHRRNSALRLSGLWERLDATSEMGITILLYISRDKERLAGDYSPVIAAQGSLIDKQLALPHCLMFYS